MGSGEKISCMENKVYVFGGAGFLGKTFIERFPTGIPCDTPQRLEQAGLNGLQFDFGKDSAEWLPCSAGDMAVIFSWRGYPAAHDEHPVAKLSLNLNATLSLLTVLVKKQVPKIIYASSGGAIYGDCGSQPVTESTPPNPMGFYGIGKSTAEMYVRKICVESGIGHSILRIGNAYGVGQLTHNLSVGLIAKVVAAAVRGEKLKIWGGGENRRDYIHAKDVASACLAVLNSNRLPSGCYNVGSGLAISILEIVRLVEETLGLRVALDHLPARPFDVGSICLDSSALRSGTGWEPRWFLRDGIRELAEAL